MSGRLTTHVLDLSRGVPASGMRIQLFAVLEGERRLLRDAVTNGDGRVDRPLLEGADFAIGEYELLFWAGDYFAEAAIEPAGGAFLSLVPVRFRIADAAAHVHVPLLAAPGGYSTYRGS